jgi:hypothetical protein
LGSLAATEAGWRLWFALAAFRIKGGFIVQTIADAGSSRRRLIVRSSDGVFIRASALEAPFGLVASNESGQHLVGFARHPVGRAICYEVVGG